MLASSAGAFVTGMRIVLGPPPSREDGGPRRLLRAWATIRPAPLPEPVLPARSRIPATTGALVRVLIVVASGDRPLRSTCLPAILVWP